VNVRQAGESFATLIVIDRGDPLSLGKWSKEILGGVGDFLRVELMQARPAPDEYAVLDSYGTPPPREQALSSSLPTLEAFLSTAPRPEAAGAAVFRRTLDGTRLLEATGKPLRAIVIISDGQDPNLYPGGVAEDTLLIERAKQLGAPIFAVSVVRKPNSNAHRAALQAASTRLQAVSVRSGGGVIREVAADDALRTQLAQALQAFSQAVGSWQRTECALCGEVPSGEVAVDLTATQAQQPVARSRQPFTTRLTAVPELPRCERCITASDCSCRAGAPASCQAGKCACGDVCAQDKDCAGGEICKQGKCQQGIPWLLVTAGVVLALFVLFVLAAVVLVGLRARGESARQREEEQRRRDAEARRIRDEDERRRREERERAEEQRRVDAQVRPAVPIAAAAAPRGVAALLRLHAQTAGYADIPLPEGATLIGGDQDQILEAVRRLPPNVQGFPVVLSGSTVSGKHAVIRVVRGVASITDLGSTNGTIVNGVRVQPNTIIELRPGDRVELSRQLVFVLEGASGKPG
jgi:hypothetical protein